MIEVHLERGATAQLLEIRISEHRQTGRLAEIAHTAVGDKNMVMFDVLDMF